MNATNWISLVGIVLGVIMAVVVGVYVGRNRVGDCLVTLSPLLGIELSEVFPGASTTKIRLAVFALVTSLVAWIIYLLVVRLMKSRRKPAVSP